MAEQKTSLVATIPSGDFVRRAGGSMALLRGSSRIGTEMTAAINSPQDA